MNDPIGDLLTRIRNSQMRGKSTVRTPASRVRAWVLDVLASEGYIRGYDRVEEVAGKPELEVRLKYFRGEPVIREIRRVSTPGRRVYASFRSLPSVRQGLGVAVISTPRGIMSDSAARAARVGGEVLCTVF